MQAATSEGCRLVQGRQTEERHALIAVHLFMVIVFPLLQGLVALSFPPQAVDMIEERKDLGLLEEY